MIDKGAMIGDMDDVRALRDHGLRYRLNGLPIFDPDTDEEVGVVAEPLWQWADLTAAQREVIELDASLVDLERHRVTADFALWATLYDYGVACFHRWVNHEPTHRECRMCRAWEQLPGLIVWVGDRQLRVPDPPPRRLRIAEPVNVSAASYMADPGPTPSAAGPKITEYEWTGNSYREVLDGT